MKPRAEAEAGASRSEPGGTDQRSLTPKQRVHEELEAEARTPRDDAEAEAWHREPGGKKIQK